MTCDVTPHHLALTDEWLAGSRQWTWEARGNPWRDGSVGAAAPYALSLRVEPPLRTASDAAACLEGLLDGTIDAVATDHMPRARPDREVEFGASAPGIGGLETALGLVLAAVDSGRLELRRAVAALTTGPARVLGAAGLGEGHAPGLTVGAPADLVVFDRSATWTPDGSTIRSLGAPSPLVGRSLPGPILLTLTSGRVAWRDPGA